MADIDIQVAVDIILISIITMAINIIKKATNVAQVFSVQKVSSAPVAFSVADHASLLFRKEVQSTRKRIY